MLLFEPLYRVKNCLPRPVEISFGVHAAQVAAPDDRRRANLHSVRELGGTSDVFAFAPSDKPYFVLSL